jgi:hypothetical protein
VRRFWLDLGRPWEESASRAEDWCGPDEDLSFPDKLARTRYLLIVAKTFRLVVRDTWEVVDHILNLILVWSGLLYRRDRQKIQDAVLTFHVSVGMDD